MPLTISFIISTRNRRDVLVETVRQVLRCGLDAEQFEIFVIDNASTDGSADAVARSFGNRVHLLRANQNRGACAKNLALPMVGGKYVVFLDDDSFPLPGSVERMVRHFEADPKLGAATFTVTLPDGSRECSAYPDVFIGCGVGLRMRALERVGGLPEDFFMQAEEYDLSLRLLNAGYKVRAFSDLHVRHLKTPNARSSSHKMRLDTRNNLILALTRLPGHWGWRFALDWTRRYRWIAQAGGQGRAWRRGVVAGLWRAFRRDDRRAVSADAFEQFAKVDEIGRRMRMACRQLNADKIAFLDCGKNLLAYWLAAQSAGVEVVAIVDDKLAAPRRKYRGVPVINEAAARKLDFHAAVVSNLSPVHAAKRLEAWRHTSNELGDGRPVVDLFDPAIEATLLLQLQQAAEALEAVSGAAADPASGSRRTAARSAG
jgi:GT2 family glycosyltransferase